MAVSRFENTVETFAILADGTLESRQEKMVLSCSKKTLHPRFRAVNIIPTEDSDPTFVAVIEN